MRSPVLSLAVWLSGASLTSLSHASEMDLDSPEYSFDTHPFNVDTFGVMASFIPGKEWDSVIQVNRGFRFAFQQYLEKVVHHSLPTSLFHTCSEDNVMHRMLSIPGSWLCSVPHNPDVMQYVPNMPAEVVKAPIQPKRVRMTNGISEFHRNRPITVCGGQTLPTPAPVQICGRNTQTVEYPGTETMKYASWIDHDLFVAYSGPSVACVGSVDHAERGLCWIIVGKEECQPLDQQSKSHFHQLISQGWVSGNGSNQEWVNFQCNLSARLKCTNDDHE